MDWPASYPLNGSDSFLLILDQLMLKNRQQGNICHFVLTFQDPLAVDVFHTAFKENEAFFWIRRLRMEGGAFFKPAEWVAGFSEGPYSVAYHELEGIEVASLLEGVKKINPRKNAPFRLELFGENNAVSHLLFTWHHALMDAHGAELFLMHLGASLDSEPLFFNSTLEASDHSEWKRMGGIKETLRELTQFPFMSSYGGKKHVCPTVVYDVLTFDEEALVTIDENIKTSGAQISKSLFFIAACSLAVKSLVVQQGRPVDDVVVTLPQDQRRRGAVGPILMNQVTFLFYRIPKAALGSTSVVVAELYGQMMDLMRQDFPRSFGRMMLLFRHLPSVLYTHLVQRVSKGRMASFFFSDTGNSLEAFTTFLGAPLKSAVHYPPNMYPPGLTFVFSKWQGQLHVTISTMKEEFSEEDRRLLRSALSKELLGEPQDS